jgi:hypothetical protein
MPAALDAPIRSTLPFTLPLAAVAALLLVVATSPGYFSFDSGFMWWQARTLQLSSLQAPGMTLLLAGMLRLGLGPGALVAFNISAFFVLIALLPALLGLGRWAALGVFLLLACCPPLLLLLPHLWTDVQLLVLLLAASAALLALARWRRVYLLSAVVALAMLCALWVRPNALAAVLPLLVAWSLLTFSGRGRQMSAVVLLLAVAFFGARAMDRIFVVEHRDAWAVPMMWDLQWLSASGNEIELPPGLYYPGLSAAQLRQTFDPDTAMGVFANPVANPGAEEFTAERRSALLAHWWQAVRTQPLPYLHHRARVFGRLLGSHRSGTGVGLIDSPGITAFRDNPPMKVANPGWHHAFRHFADALKAHGASAAWPWLVLGMGLLLIRSLRRLPWDDIDRTLLTIAASGWCYLLPFALIAPSTELRYAAWPIAASLLSGAGLWARAALRLHPARSSTN